MQQFSGSSVSDVLMHCLNTMLLKIFYSFINIIEAPHIQKVKSGEF